jgi:hypothetical protein
MICFRPYGDITTVPMPRTDADTALYVFLSNTLGAELQTSAEVDYEDWMEPAAMLAGALKAGFAVNILPHTALPEAIANPDFSIPGTDAPNILIGRTKSRDASHLKALGFVWPLAENDEANRYGELSTFARHAGRRTQLAHFPGEEARARGMLGQTTPGMDIDDALAQFDETLIIKQVQPAKAYPVFKADKQGRSGSSILFDEMDYHVCRFEGDQNALLLQDVIDMRFEARIFVINGQVITGAGIVEENTPQQNQIPVFDPVFETRRNDGSRVFNPELAEKYFHTGQTIAQEILEESGLSTYVLDLALDENDNVIVIELNPIAESGLYAINAPQLVNAIVAHTQTLSQD